MDDKKSRPDAGAEADVGAILGRTKHIITSYADADQQLTASDYASRKQADDQSHIARMVIDLFRWSVAAILGVLIFDFVARLNGLSVDNAALIREVIDFVKVSILPLVTLVLGFYFGRLEGSKKDTQK